jgi:hypothetical protein
MGKGKRLKKLKQNNPQPGDTLVLHRDFLSTPAGKYRLEAIGESYISLSIGDAYLTISREAYRFCSIKKRPLSPREVQEGYAALERRSEELCKMHGVGTEDSCVVELSSELQQLIDPALLSIDFNEVVEDSNLRNRKGDMPR